MARRSGVLFRSTPASLALDHKLRRLARGEGAIIARRAVAVRLKSLIAEGFAKTQGPRGEQWAPRVPPTGPWPLLRKTGKMFASYAVKVFGPQITIANSAVSDQGRPYPLFHQKGTRKMVARKTVPDRTFSAHWRAELGKVVKLALEHLK